jgi:hypothetical protein
VHQTPHLIAHRTAAAALVALMLALMAVLVPARLADQSFTFGGSQSSSASGAAAPLHRMQMRPAWVRDPLASPLSALR